LIVCVARAARWLPGGRIIRYTAVQVAARRAARIVCWSVGIVITTLPPLPSETAPPDLIRPWPGVVPWVPPWPGSVPRLLPQFDDRLPQVGPELGIVAPINTPEPGTLAVLGAAAVALIAARRRN
jgi:hypothetical protein